MARLWAVTSGPASSTGSPMTFMMRPSVSLPTGTEIGAPGIDDLLAANETFTRVHGDGADFVFAQMLSDFENQTVAVIVGFERVQNRRQFAFESNVDDGADNLGDFADRAGSCLSHFLTLFS